MASKAAVAAIQKRQNQRRTLTRVQDSCHGPRRARASARGRPNLKRGPAGSSTQQASESSVRHTRIIVAHYGGPDALRLVEEECPEPKDGEVRVRVLAAGVSLPDIMAREGVHPETPLLPFTPGWDLVGVVD